MLLELVLAQRQRQLRAIDRRGNLSEHIRHRADVVLVAVRDKVAANLVAVALQIGRVRNHQIDAGHVLSRKDGSQIHHDDVVLILIDGQVFSDLAQTAQRNNFEPRLSASSSQSQILL